MARPGRLRALRASLHAARTPQRGKQVNAGATPPDGNKRSLGCRHLLARAALPSCKWTSLLGYSWGGEGIGELFFKKEGKIDPALPLSLVYGALRSDGAPK